MWHTRMFHCKFKSKSSAIFSVFVIKVSYTVLLFLDILWAEGMES